ncbi:hypothetical protein LCGC14_3064300, partial [marine sediment metagenome]
MAALVLEEEDLPIIVDIQLEEVVVVDTQV